jgi:[protein-PII] uridylyltransferase
MAQPAGRRDQHPGADHPFLFVLPDVQPTVTRMMSDYLSRARSALRNLLGGGGPSEGAATPGVAVRLDDNLALVDGRLAFANADRAASNPSAWLTLFEAALERDVPIADAARDLLRAQTRQMSADTMLWGSAQHTRFVVLLRPRPGLSARLSEMRAAGVLDVLFPGFFTDGADTHSLAAVANLERLLSQSDLSGTRFGAMLRELEVPELVVLALLLHHPAGAKEHAPSNAADLAQPILDRLHIEGDARYAIDFLIDNQLQVAQFAFRHDTGDSAVVARFASVLTDAAQLNSITTEELLKMLTLLTIGDLGAAGREPLTSWKAELVWRLFVDSYNHLTMAYGDEVIDRSAAARTGLHRDRPPDISEAELVEFLEGLPQRYLTLFDAATIYQHVRLRRNIGPDDVHSFLTRKGEAWELTIVTLDKPYLFANICGVLALEGADILRGQALTSRSGLVLDVFEFMDAGRPILAEEFNRLLADVVGGRVDITSRLAEQHPSNGTRTAVVPLLYFDDDSSQRYTVLEVVAADAPGLLHRISRALSSFGCEVDLVLISTEAAKAIDVFHMTKGGAKLSESDQLALTAHLEQALEAFSASPPT